MLTLEEQVSHKAILFVPVLSLAARESKRIFMRGFEI